ncbi:MAG TPA: NAD-dependent epimerase/dehydratase family protein [Kiritimatiellae bacterium]|nr:NAD-dependent epimerase/dehydratase family protein [Kiritimatiellia bacterium]
MHPVHRGLPAAKQQQETAFGGNPANTREPPSLVIPQQVPVAAAIRDGQCSVAELPAPATRQICGGDVDYASAGDDADQYGQRDRQGGVYLLERLFHGDVFRQCPQKITGIDPHNHVNRPPQLVQRHRGYLAATRSLRFFSVYGPRGRPDMMPYHITDCIVHDRAFTLYEGGEMYRDWTYIDDIVSGVVAAVDRPMGYEVINLGRGEPVRMADFVELVEEIVGKPARMTTPPAPPSEPPVTYADISKARALLGYNPTTSVAEGMHRFWEWYRENVLADQ